MPRFARWARALTAVSAAALMPFVGMPGMASANTGRPQAEPEERAAALIRPAVMYLSGESYGLVRLPSGEILSQFGRGTSMPFLTTWVCTAFVVNPDGWVATAGHCVDPESARLLILKRAADEYRSEFPDLPESREPAATFEWLKKNARVEGDTADQGPHTSFIVISGTGKSITEKMPANVVDFRSLGKGDAALLKLAKRNLPSSELDTDAEVTIGTSILAVGFPASTEQVTGTSLDPTYKSGKISKKSIMGSNPEYETDAATTEGMSGGPAIGLNGKVVGVNSFAPAGETQAFNFIAPADGVAALLASKGVKPMLGPADLLYRKGLGHFFSGRYTDAISDFDQTMAMSPGYPGVQDLKTNAVNLRQQYGDASSLRATALFWCIAISVTAVVSLAAGLTFIARKVRRRPLPVAAALGLTPESAGPPAQGGSGQAITPDEPLSVSKVDDETGGGQRLRLIPRQPWPADEPHFCANCGAEHHPAERFCPNCGHQIVQDQRGKPA